MKDRKHFSKGYLQSALDSALIEMTIPDKPCISKQKYRLTDKGEKWLEGYKKLKPFRTGIERTFGLVKENRYRMEISNFYKGIDNVTIHAIEHDIVLTQDIVFDYLKSGRFSPLLNLNY